MHMQGDGGLASRVHGLVGRSTLAVMIGSASERKQNRNVVGPGKQSVDPTPCNGRS